MRIITWELDKLDASELHDKISLLEREYEEFVSEEPIDELQQLFLEFEELDRPLEMPKELKKSTLSSKPIASIPISIPIPPSPRMPSTTRIPISPLKSMRSRKLIPMHNT
jgi:hypothetical protein